MKEKAKNLIYFDADKYININSIKVLPWATIIIPIFILVGSIVKHWTGMIVAVCVWFFSSVLFVNILQSNCVKKTFRIRFLVNGVVSFYVFAILSLIMIATSMATGSHILLWLLPTVFAFVVVYICMVVYTVHIDGFKKIRKSSYF